MIRPILEAIMLIFLLKESILLISDMYVGLCHFLIFSFLFLLKSFSSIWPNGACFKWPHLSP